MTSPFKKKTFSASRLCADKNNTDRRLSMATGTKEVLIERPEREEAQRRVGVNS
jgi:hypothetical protein